MNAQLGQGSSLKQYSYRVFVQFSLAIGDVLLATLCFLLAFYLRIYWAPQMIGIAPFTAATSYANLWPVLVLLVLLRKFFGLYPGYALHPAEELRRQTQATFSLIAIVFTGSALFQFNESYSRLVLLLASLLLLLVLPLARAGLKYLLARSPHYGLPIWVIGSPARALKITELIKAKPVFGLRIVGMSEGSLPLDTSIKHCLLFPDHLPEAKLSQVLDRLRNRFRHVWLMPNLLEIASVWVSARDVSGYLALELSNNLMHRHNQLFKRSMDIFLSLLGMIVALPLFIAIALFIRFGSTGPVIIRQVRLGFGGKPFKTYKFRTMRQDAEEVLERLLNSDPLLKEEWQTLRKLKNDPRITFIGKFLRRYSLDELPQLFNILKGDMSLVGPRPVQPDELALYGESGSLYTSVRPGLSGLMQVSGRNELSYEQRVHLDAYYIRNWSIWLDLVILSRTVVAVLSTRGAY